MNSSKIFVTGIGSAIGFFLMCCALYYWLFPLSVAPMNVVFQFLAVLLMMECIFVAAFFLIVTVGCIVMLEPSGRCRFI